MDSDSGTPLLTRLSISHMITMQGDTSGKHHLVYGVLDLSHLVYSETEHFLGMATAHTSDIRIDQLQVNRFWSVVKVYVDLDEIPLGFKHRIHERVPDVTLHRMGDKSRGSMIVRSIGTSPTALVRAVCYALGVDQPIVNHDEEHRLGIRRSYNKEKTLAAQTLHVINLAEALRPPKFQRFDSSDKFLSKMWDGRLNAIENRRLSITGLHKVREVLIGVLSAEPDPTSWWLRD